jgi:hypothetical protein
MGLQKQKETLQLEDPWIVGVTALRIPLLCLLLYSPLAYVNTYKIFVTLWSSGQSSWLQIQGSGFDSPRYQIF